MFESPKLYTILFIISIDNFNNIKFINDDIINVIKNKKLEKNIVVFGNLPYNISTKILTSLMLLDNWPPWYDVLIFMFQKEVADRIIAEHNNKNYGRLSILTSWKINTKKIKDVSANSFFPSPKVKSTILLMEPKKNVFNIKNPKNLEYITKIFFNQRRKMIRKPLNILFKNPNEIAQKLNLNLNDRPQNLSPLIYFKICKEYEDLL